MQRFLSAGVALVILSACSSSYSPPSVSQAEIDAAAERAKKTELAINRRTPEEMVAMVERVEERLHPAAMALCAEVGRRACRFSLHVVPSRSVGAGVDRAGNAIIGSGLLAYLESEDELAFAAAHEFAHHLADHANRRSNGSAATVGAMAAAAAAAGMGAAPVIPNVRQIQREERLRYSREQEREADYLGAYVVAGAGYDVAAGQAVLDKLSALSGDYRSQSFLSTHPSSPERAASIEKVVTEIRAKRDAGVPLVPSR